MPAETFVMTVRVSEAALRETGDAGTGDRAGENAINVALLWPRPGRSEVVGTTGLVRLGDHPGPHGGADKPAAFAAPVLKEVVEGDVALLVHVTDRDRTGAVARFLRGVAAAALGDAAALAGSGGLARHAFSEALERGSMAVAGGRDDERVDVVAVAPEPLCLGPEDFVLLADSGESRLLRVGLVAPFDLGRPREKGRLAPGRPNGHLVLDVRVTRR